MGSRTVFHHGGVITTMEQAVDLIGFCDVSICVVPLIARRLRHSVEFVELVCAPYTNGWILLRDCCNMIPSGTELLI